MRKAYASDLYRDKVNQAAVKKLMGHKFESTSINWYAKSDDEEIKEAAKKRTYKKNKKVYNSSLAMKKVSIHREILTSYQ